VVGQGDVVQGEPLPAAAAEVGLIDHRSGGAQPARGLARAGAGGDHFLGGRGVAGQQRHLRGHRIGGAGRLGQASAPTQQARHARVDLLAPDVQAPVFEAAAAQVGAELAGDEGGEAVAAALVGGRQEGLKMALVRSCAAGGGECRRLC
jgi:hypothetical protein